MLDPIAMNHLTQKTYAVPWKPDALKFQQCLHIYNQINFPSIFPDNVDVQ